MSNLSKQMERRHLRAVRMLGYCLVLDTSDDWLGLSAVLAVRLTPRERAALAFAVLRSMAPEHGIAAAQAALADGAGAPLAPLFDVADEAMFWASIASPEDINAYAVATFKAMSRSKRRDFIDYANEVAA